MDPRRDVPDDDRPRRARGLFGPSRRTLAAQIEHEARAQRALQDELARLRDEVIEARTDAARERARADELAKRVRFHEDRYGEVVDSRDRVLSWVASAEDRVARLLDDAHARAREIDRDARRETAESIEAMLQAARGELEHLEEQAAELRAYRTELEGSVRAALARFEHSLSDLIDARHRPVPRPAAPHAVKPRLVEPSTTTNARPLVQAVEAPPRQPAQSVVAPTPDPDATVMMPVTGSSIARPRTGHGPTRTIEVVLSGVESFQLLSEVELTITALPGVERVWVRDFGGGVAHVEVSLPVDQALAPLLAGVFEARMRERSASELHLDFSADAASADAAA